MSGDLYVKSVIDHVPYGLPLREQLAMELRGLIAERVSHGQPLDEILQQLGDPLTLAESYLSAIPLNSAGLLRRLAAKAIDACWLSVSPQRSPRRYSPFCSLKDSHSHSYPYSASWARRSGLWLIR